MFLTCGITHFTQKHKRLFPSKMQNHYDVKFMIFSLKTFPPLSVALHAFFSSFDNVKE